MYGTVDLQLYLQICMHARIERLHAGYTAGTILAMSTGTIDTCSAAVPRYYLQYGSSSDVSVRLAAVAIGCGGTGTGTTDSISTGTGRRWAWSLLPQLASSTTAVDLGPSQLVPVGVDWSTTVASQQYLARSTAVDLAITGRRWLVYRYQLGSSTTVERSTGARSRSSTGYYRQLARVPVRYSISDTRYYMYSNTRAMRLRPQRLPVVDRTVRQQLPVLLVQGGPDNGSQISACAHAKF